jgi:hypothetical protein
MNTCKKYSFCCKNILLTVSIIKEKEIIQSGGNKIKTPYYEIEGLTVWGATAMMISELNVVVEQSRITFS